MNGEKVLWTDTEVYISDDVVIRPVTERAETMMIELADGDVSVIVNRHEGEVAGQYLGIYAAHVDGLSEETLGVIGECDMYWWIVFLPKICIFAMLMLCSISLL